MMTILITQLVFAAFALHWIPQTSGSLAGLRGLSVSSPLIAWATGTKGTVLRTLDAGSHWQTLTVPGAEALDFRDVVAFSADTALIMGSGTGDASRLYLTKNGGHNWTVVLRNPDPAGFFDALKFWNATHGILLGDPVGGIFAIFTTSDGGLTWARQAGAPALANESVFAASGTCLTLLGAHEAWFGTGGTAGARVFHSSNNGNTWSVAAVPLFGGTASAGIFSLAFLNSNRGVAVGGDYQRPLNESHTFARTDDGGKSWTAAGGIPGGFRSAVAYLKSQRILIAVGTSGSDYSLDGGATWQRFSAAKLNAIAGQGSGVWAVGPEGLILKLGWR